MYSELGKIWVVWNPSVTVTVISKALQIISCKVVWPESQKEMVISIIYASNYAEERKELWNEMIRMANSQAILGTPWIALGDFNQVLHPNEHSGYVNAHIDRRTRIFRSCLMEADLYDLNYRGNSFKWWNKNIDILVAKKLDRILVNDEWLVEFPASVGLFGSPDFSDHASMSVTMSPTAQHHKKLFGFYNLLLRNKDFISLVRSEWYSCNVTGSSMYMLSKKLKLLKNPIREFSRHNYSNIEKRAEEAHVGLLMSQDHMLC